MSSCFIGFVFITSHQTKRQSLSCKLSFRRFCINSQNSKNTWGKRSTDEGCEGLTFLVLFVTTIGRHPHPWRMNRRSLWLWCGYSCYPHHHRRTQRKGVPLETDFILFLTVFQKQVSRWTKGRVTDLFCS